MKHKLMTYAVKPALFIALFLVARALMQGDPIEGKAPTISHINISGAAIPVDTNKPTLIHFWATWCSVCELERSNIESLIEEGHQVLNIATQSGSNEELFAFAQANGMNPKHIINDEHGTLFQQFGARAVPASFFISPDGQIQFIEVGYTTTLGMRLRLWLSE